MSEVCYLPGKVNFAADCLSRSPVFQPEASELKYVLVQTLKVEAFDPKLEAIILAANEDDSYQEVIEARRCTEDCKDLHRNHPGRLFMKVWNFLAFEKNVGLLTVNGRIVVPRKAQKHVLENLHVAHTGEVKTYYILLAKYETRYYQPGLRMPGMCGTLAFQI